MKKNITYDNIHELHDETLWNYIQRRKKITSELLKEIDIIKLNIKKLVSTKDAVLNSIEDDEQAYLTSIIDTFTSSFEDIDFLINNLERVTQGYDLEISKHLFNLDSPANHLSKEDTATLLSKEDIVYTCPNCSISFSTDSIPIKCPSCDALI